MSTVATASRRNQPLGLPAKEAYLNLKRQHGFFIILFATDGEKTKKPIHKWGPGRPAVSDEQILKHRGLIGYRLDEHTPWGLDVDFHDDEDPRYPHELTEPLKHTETDYFVEPTLRKGYHIYFPPGRFVKKPRRGAVPYSYRGLEGELRWNATPIVLYDPVGFLDWWETAKTPPPIEFTEALLETKARPSPQYHNPLLREFWPALVLKQNTGRLIKKWNREGYASDFIKLTTRKTRRRFRHTLKMADEAVIELEARAGRPPMRGFGRPILRLMLLLGEKEAESYALRQTIADAVGCCVATVSRWRTEFQRLGILKYIGYHVLKLWPSGWQDRVPRFAMPQFLKTVTVKSLFFGTSGGRYSLKETFRFEVGARAPPVDVISARPLVADFSQAQNLMAV